MLEERGHAGAQGKGTFPHLEDGQENEWNSGGKLGRGGWRGKYSRQREQHLPSPRDHGSLKKFRVARALREEGGETGIERGKSTITKTCKVLLSRLDLTLRANR